MQTDAELVDVDVEWSAAWGPIVDAARSDWRVPTGAAVLAIHVLTILRIWLDPAAPLLGADSALFEHAGWLIADRGYVPYTDIWDIKPPVIWYVAATLATVAGAPVALHVLSMVVVVGAAVGTALLAGMLVEDVTDDPIAAAITSLTMPAWAAWHVTATGLRAEYLALAAGLGALWLARQDRPAWAGAAVAISCGTYQWALPFALFVTGVVVERGASWRQYLTGGAIATAVVLGPVVVWGVLQATIVEAILVPALVSSEPAAIYRPRFVIDYLGWWMPFVAFAIGGALLRRDVWWIGQGIAVFGTIALLLDLDNYPDLLFVVVFVALGTGLLVAERPRWRPVVAGTLAVTLAVSVVVFGGVGVVAPPATGHAGAVEDPSITAEASGERMRAYYWERIEPETCHYRLSRTEQMWLDETGRTVESPCGEWPDDLDLFGLTP